MRAKFPFWIWAKTTQLGGSFLAGLADASRLPAEKLVILLSALSTLPRVGFEPADLRAWVKSAADAQP